jgi:methyl-accepting chemotaxis protein
MRISLRNLLLGLFATFSMTICFLVGRDLLSQMKEYRDYSEVVKLTTLDRAFFNALLGLRNERGDSSQALLLPIEKASSTFAIVAAGRKDTSAAMDQATAAKNDVTHPDMQAAINDVMRGFDRLRSLRTEIDSAFKTPLEQRDPTLNSRWMQETAGILQKLEDGSAALEGRIRALDARMVPMIQIRSSSWAARGAGGNAALVLNDIIASNRKMTEADYSNITLIDTRVSVLWQIVQGLIAHPSTPDSLRRSFAKAEGDFFTGSFADMRKKIIEVLHAGQPSPIGIDEWRTKNTAALKSVALVAMAAMDALETSATDVKGQAFTSVLTAIGLFALTLAFAVIAMLSILQRVIRPLGRMTNCLETLSKGEYAITVPDTQKADEIGDVARAVEILRQAGLRARQLELEAEEARKRGEMERLEVQRLAEEEAEIRLQRATGALADGLKQLAAGNMACEIDEQFAPQFEGLRQDFNASVSQLRSVLLAVAHVAGTVHANSGEVSDASSNLSRRTEQQAASLEETASALEQITANVHATSRRAADARNVVRDAKSRADESAQVVKDAVIAMERIEGASQQISQIIGVIDEIAFQTNLLALNAGVEAARAGDAGKGFAVVAQEVRELAQRSANAAKEIKGLISNSATAVGEGVRLVSHTGDGLSAIEILVQQANAHMDAIATAAQEQSAGLAQVNTAVNHMDQATQQNAAMVEEMSAAGAGLAQESSNLTGLLGRFQLGSAVGELRQTAAQMRAEPAVSRPVSSPPSRGAVPRRAMGGGSAAVASKADEWQEF